jgi:hypothetical protein
MKNEEPNFATDNSGLSSDDSAKMKLALQILKARPQIVVVMPRDSVAQVMTAMLPTKRRSMCIHF